MENQKSMNSSLPKFLPYKNSQMVYVIKSEDYKYWRTALLQLISPMNDEQTSASEDLGMGR